MIIRSKRDEEVVNSVNALMKQTGERLKIINTTHIAMISEALSDFELWQSQMKDLGESLADGIADLNIIDSEKVNAYLGTDDAMIIDDNTLILPPESK